jgi:hypothetical protein
MSMGNRPSFSREAKLQWAGSRERNLASGRGGAFFLTSLFIELIDSVLDQPTPEQYQQKWQRAKKTDAAHENHDAQPDRSNF